MPVRRQLSVFLENKVGQIAAVGSALARAKVNIIALTVSDSIEYGVLRLVVSDAAKAQKALSRISPKVISTPVLAVEMGNVPGALAQVARKLSAARINIDYMYGSAGAMGTKSVGIFKVSDPRAAEAALKK